LLVHSPDLAAYANFTLSLHDALPILDAARQVGAIQIQARGTWAGNVVNASPAADGVPVLMAYDAVVVLESRRGREEVSLDRFYSDRKSTRLNSSHGSISYAGFCLKTK